MEKTLDVAKTMYDMYYDRYNERMDEMKMHKLMYFLQRESLMQSGDRLFKADFYGWKYGPILKEVRSEYMKCADFRDTSGKVSSDTKKLVSDVLDRYGTLSSWKLSSLSHEEVSWKNARDGLEASDNGNKKLSLDAMKLDAAMESLTRA